MKMIHLAIDEQLILEPLVYALRHVGLKHPFQLHFLPEKEILRKLENNDVQMGILSPLIYAQKKSELRILRDFPIYSQTPDCSCLLYFKGNLKRIDTIFYAEDETYQFENIVGRIVIEEFLGLVPEWQLLKSFTSVEENLQNFPVIMLSGSHAFDNCDSVEGHIDLTEEWMLKTDLPLLHRFPVVNSHFKDEGAIEALKLSREVGLRNLRKISQKQSENAARSWDIYFDILQKFHYYPDTPEVWSSLAEFIQYLYFKGYTEHYPEIQYY